MKCVYFHVRYWEWFRDLLLICWSCFPCCKLCFDIKMVISSFSFEHVIALHLRHGCNKSYVIRWCTISRVVSCDVMDIIFRERYRALRWLLLSRIVSCAITDAWTVMSPMGLRLRDNGCVSLGKTCITVLDIAFH